MEVPTNQIKGRSMSKIIRVGIDLSKSVFVLYGHGGRDNNRTSNIGNAEPIYAFESGRAGVLSMCSLGCEP
jgi:hypothetical protein